MVKAKKKKRDRSGRAARLRERLAEREAELERALRRERDLRKRAVRLAEGVHDALEAVNPHNYKFVCDIMAQRLRRFADTEITADSSEREGPENVENDD